MGQDSSDARSGWFRAVLVAVIMVGLGWMFVRENTERQASFSPSAVVAASYAQAEDSKPSGKIPKAVGLSNMFRMAASRVLPAVVVVKSGSSPACPRCGRHHADRTEHEIESDPSRATMGLTHSLDVLGSGFVVDPSGTILTNKHVATAGHRLVVQTADGKQFPVEEVKTDREHDLAILRIDPEEPLASVRLGDSSMAEIGDGVLTIGSPLELEQTVSAGIVSAKNRSLCPKHPAKYIQTDAVVNPGSSGGPLVNLQGEAIGITTAILSEDGGYQGISFAIPIDHAARLLEQSFSERDLAVSHSRASHTKRWPSP